MTSLGVNSVFLHKNVPLVDILRKLGYRGEDPDIVAKVWRQDPHSSTSCKLIGIYVAANSGTVTHSCDNEDPRQARVHFTPANLSSNFIAAIEAPITTKLFQTNFC